MMAFNVYQIDWQTPLEGKSTVAVIGALASGSAFLLLLILQLARKIKQKSESLRNLCRGFVLYCRI